MGFLQKLFGGGSIIGPKRNSEGYPFGDGWYQLSEEEQYTELERFLGQIGESFSDAKVVRRKNDEEIDLKVKVRGFPVRLRLSRGTLDCSELILKHQSPLGFIDLECDLEKKPEAEPEADEDFDEDEGKRIFVGPGVYFDGSDAEQAAGEFARLPEEFRTALLESLPADGVLYFRIRPEEVDVTLRVEPMEMKTPASTLTRIIDLMGKAAQAVGAAGPKEKKKAAPLVRCSFCQAQQYLPKTGRCCNCGAPFTD
jgi:hypothetical protein